jgi:hypothetical protein
MSRYRITNSKGQTLEYGFDRPLQQYFGMLYTGDLDQAVEEPDEDNQLIAGDTLFGQSRTEMFEMFEQFGLDLVPDKHREAVALDMEF